MIKIAIYILWINKNKSRLPDVYSTNKKPYRNWALRQGRKLVSPMAMSFHEWTRFYGFPFLLFSYSAFLPFTRLAQSKEHVTNDDNETNYRLLSPSYRIKQLSRGS